MTLVATGTGSPIADIAAIPNCAFWPSVNPADMRSCHRLDGTVTPARLADAIRLAMRETNRILATFEAEHAADGIASHAAIPTAPWMTATHYADCYRSAVYSAAHAWLLLGYLDLSATAAASPSEEKAGAADGFLRQARCAVAEILGRPHSTVELI